MECVLPRLQAHTFGLYNKHIGFYFYILITLFLMFGKNFYKHYQKKLDKNKVSTALKKSIVFK